MKKILFTDILGTIRVPDNTFQECIETELLGDYFNEFLDNGNYLAFVTRTGIGHYNVNTIMETSFLRYYNVIYPEFWDQVSCFCVGTVNENLYDNIEVFKENNISYYRSFPNRNYDIFNNMPNELIVTKINNKADAIDIKLNEIDGTCKIYAIGDDENDVSMFIRAIEKGGQASFILSSNIYPPDIFTSLDPNDAKKIINRNYSAIGQLKESKFSSFSDMWKEFAESEKSLYLHRAETEKGIENAKKYIDKIGFYWNFPSYYQKVLKK